MRLLSEKYCYVISEILNISGRLCRSNKGLRCDCIPFRSFVIGLELQCLFRDFVKYFKNCKSDRQLSSVVFNQFFLMLKTVVVFFVVSCSLAAKKLCY